MSYDLDDRAAPRARARHVPRHRRAFHRFYREHFGLVWSMVRRFGVPTAEHEDAVQEVWLVAYRRLSTLEPDASAKAWLSTITRRVASRLRRTEHRKARKLDALHVASERSHGPSSSGVEDHDARRLLEALLAGLDDDQRDVLVLAHVHGLSGPEIAEALEIPLNTAYSRLRLARRRVDRFVAEAGTEQALVIGALRRSEEPPPRAAARVWVAMLPQLGGPGAGAAASAAASSGGIAGAKVFAIAVVVGLVGLATARAVVDASVGAQRERVVSVESRTRGDVASSPSSAAPRAAVSSSPTSAPPEATTPAREPTVLDGAPSSRAGRSPNKAAAAPSPSMLEAETELLGRAQQALREGDAAAALHLLDEHERRFPAGELGDARRGARVRALCGLGRAAQARAEAALLLRERPHSPVAAGVADVCSSPG